MALMADLLALLERQDTFPAADALDKVMVSEPPEGWSEGSLAAIWLSVDQEARGLLVSWAESRLDHWHSLKANAVCSAWENDPGSEVEHGQRCNTIIQAVAMDLRTGLERHPELVWDAKCLQHLAASGHSFAWSQVYKELLQDQPGFDLEPSSPDFVLYCQLSFHVFSSLLPEGQ